jgi:hypothetical protein
MAPADQKPLVPTYQLDMEDLRNALAGQIGLKRAGKADPARYVPAFEALLKLQEGYMQNRLVDHVARRLTRPVQGRPLTAPLAHLAHVIGHNVPDILMDDQARRTARIKAWAEAIEGQTDIEDAIAGAAA